MVANLPTRTIRQYCHTLSIFFSIAWYIVVSNLHRLESNYYCPYMYRILLMWKQQPEMYHLLNPVSLCVEVMARSKMPSWSLNVHPFTKVPVQDILLVLFASFFVFSVHYPEGCCNFYSLLEVLFLNKKIPPRKPRLSALVIQLRDSLQWTCVRYQSNKLFIFYTHSLSYLFIMFLFASIKCIVLVYFISYAFMVKFKSAWQALASEIHYLW